MKSAWRLKLKYPHRKYLLIQLFCLSACVAFFSLTTSSILAQPKDQVQKTDPFTLTPEKQGLFQGLPEKFKGLFNSDSQVLNGFFQFIERNLGGASAQQTPPTTPTYPPYAFPMPVSADFIKVTSSWSAGCIQDIPPDELHPPTTQRQDETCPWAAKATPGCPMPRGQCASTDCYEMCITSVSCTGQVIVNFHWIPNPNPACYCADHGDINLEVPSTHYVEMCPRVLSDTAPNGWPSSCGPYNIGPLPHGTTSLCVRSKPSHYVPKPGSEDACRLQTSYFIEACMTVVCP